MDPISKLDPSMYGSTISQPHDRVATLQFLENPPLPAWMDAGEIGGNMYDSSATQFMGRYRTDIGYDNDEDNNGNSIQHGQEQTGRIGEDGEREPMFEKPLTPSDVGKLNRLVIPKQHAERFFPLDGEAGEKGLQLSFEDEVGKVWRFRYSYWNSSQSYVLTKGWSRFVKEKRLDAGDVVSFERYRPDGEKFYIGWRRRSAAPSAVVQESGTAPVVPSTGIMWGPLFYPLYPPYPSPPHATCNNIEGEPVNGNSTAPATSKRLRLFGVNLDCPADGPPEPDSSHWLINDGTHTSFPPGNHCNCSSSQI